MECDCVEHQCGGDRHDAGDGVGDDAGALRVGTQSGAGVELEELSGGKVADQSAVGGQELVGHKVFEPDPAELFKDAVLELAGKLMDSEELEVDSAAMAIIVADAGDKGTDGGLDAEFFVEFADQGLLRAFTGLDFASGKLPLEGHGLVGAALADQDFTAAHNQGRGHEAKGGAKRAVFAGEIFFHASSVSAPDGSGPFAGKRNRAQGFGIGAKAGLGGKKVHKSNRPRNRTGALLATSE